MSCARRRAGAARSRVDWCFTPTSTGRRRWPSPCRWRRGSTSSPRWLDSQYLYDAPGLGAVRAHHRAARVLPDAHRGRAAGPARGPDPRDRRRRDAGGAGLGLVDQDPPAARRLDGAGALPLHPGRRQRETLARACRELCRRYPQLSVEALAASYERALPLLPQASPMLLAFLGSSLGNLGQHGQSEFLGLIADSLGAGRLLPGGAGLRPGRRAPWRRPTTTPPAGRRASPATCSCG